MTEGTYSVLRGWPVRAFPVALGQVLAHAADRDPRRSSLTRLYLSLSGGQRAECQAELVRLAVTPHSVI